jgi:hypothetical protein
MHNLESYALKRMAFDIMAPRKLERIILARGLQDINLSGIMGFPTRDSIRRNAGKAPINAIREARTKG